MDRRKECLPFCQLFIVIQWRDTSWHAPGSKRVRCLFEVPLLRQRIFNHCLRHNAISLRVTFLFCFPIPLPSPFLRTLCTRFLLGVFPLKQALGRTNHVFQPSLSSLHPVMECLPVDTGMGLRYLYRRLESAVRRPLQCVDVHIGVTQDFLTQGLETVVGV